jgi:hypothetical protein
MKWMLIVMVFGVAPVKTDLLFDSLDDCLKAEENIRGEYARAYNIWIKWAQQNPTESAYPKNRDASIKRILYNAGTCVPHAPLKNSN